MLRSAALAGALAGAAGALAPGDLYVPFSGDSLAPFVSSTTESYTDSVVAVKAPLDTTGVAEGDVGLVLSQEARRYAVTAPLPEPVSPADDKPLVVQYEVATQDGLTCGGAYVKLYDETVDPATVTPNSPYTIMFGPDRCGATDKVHLIIRFKNPVTGEVEEKHLAAPPRPKADKLSHLYRLELTPDAKYRISIDDKVEKEGSLATDFTPALLPPAQIADPSDSKPADWVDEAQIPDPEAKKPEDWDEDAPAYIEDADAVKPEGWLDEEPHQVPDPAASKPEDWDDEEDGEWEAPLVPNPKCADAPGCGEWKRPQKKNPAYKGKWRAPLIANPAYKGVWEPRKIANPAFFEDSHLNRLQGAKIGSVGVEVWTMNKDILFDNFLVTRDAATAGEIAASTWAPKHAAQEAKAATDAAKAAEEAGDKAEGLPEKAKALFEDAVAYAQRAPAVAGAAAVGLLLFLVITISAIFAGGKKAPAAAEAAPAAAEAAPAAAEPKVNAAGAEESEQEEEKEEEPADKAAKAGGARKRPARRAA